VTARPIPTRYAGLLAAAGLASGLGVLTPTEAMAWTRSSGPRGGQVAVGPRGAAAVGPRGGAAVAGRYGAAAVGPGGAAAVARPGYPARPPAYPAYRRPVPVYPGYASPAPVAGAVAAGVVAGVTAGAVAGAVASAATPPPATTVVVASPTPAGGLPIGTEMSALPTGCTQRRVGSATYFQCGGAWLRAFMHGANVSYVVVAPP
jgi:hypothetical protein